MLVGGRDYTPLNDVMCGTLIFMVSDCLQQLDDPAAQKDKDIVPHAVVYVSESNKILMERQEGLQILYSYMQSQWLVWFYANARDIHQLRV